MLNSICELFKIGIGPSSSHTNGPMLAANEFIRELESLHIYKDRKDLRIECTLTGSLAYTGLGHGTDQAILLGLNGYSPERSAALCLKEGYEPLLERLRLNKYVSNGRGLAAKFDLDSDLIFDRETIYPEHPNGLLFSLMYDVRGKPSKALYSKIYFSIGGGFVKAKDGVGIDERKVTHSHEGYPYRFNSAKDLLHLCTNSNMSISDIQLENELSIKTSEALNKYINSIKDCMFACVERGLVTEGVLPGGLKVKRRAKALFEHVNTNPISNVNDYLLAYAMAVNEENAAGHSVVTAPTNGAAGVIPAVLYYLSKHHAIGSHQVKEFFLTATVIGSLIKNNSSISGAEVGCQGEIGAASAMAAAGCCAVMGGAPKQVENAAEIALEHHMGMTCDPVKGLVQIPCIERNGFGAIKAYAASSLALHGDGSHIISLDNCIAAMKQTGDEMSIKFKETSQGGLAVNWVDC